MAAASLRGVPQTTAPPFQSSLSERGHLEIPVSFSSDFHLTAGKVVRALKALQSDWMLIGAIPVAAWGQARATTDADFAVSLELIQSHDLDEGMMAQGFRKIEAPVQIPQKQLILSKYWDDATSIGVDLFYSSGSTNGQFQKEALQRKKEVAFDDKNYPVAAPEDLILYKVLAYRQKDLDDVGTVLERQFKSLDWPYVRAWSERLGLFALLRDVATQFLDEQGLPSRLPWDS